MLKTINLDTTTFQEVFDKNKRYLQSLLPYIDVDRDSEPTITILEMLTMLSDIQNYNINRILPKHYEKYMALLGVVRNPGQSARGHVFVYPKVSQKLLMGTTFVAKDDTVIKYFESTVFDFVVKNKIVGYFLQVHNTCTPIFNQQPILLDDTKVQYLYILFKDPIVSTTTLYFTLSKNKRNVGVNLDYSEAKLEAEYYCKQGWKKCVNVQDQTNGLLQSGSITITPYFDSTLLELQRKIGYPIRLIIREASYEITPIIQRIEINPVSLIQKKTLIYQREVTINNDYIEYLHILEKKGDVLLLKKENNSYQEALFIKDNDGIIVLDNSNQEATFLIISRDKLLDRKNYVFDILGVSSQEISIDIPNINNKTLQFIYKKENRYFKLDSNLYDQDTQILSLGNGKDYPILSAQKDGLIISQADTTLYREGNIRHNTLKCEDEGIKCIYSLASYGSKSPETMSSMLERVKETYGRQVDILDRYHSVVLETPYLPIKAVKVFTRQQFYRNKKEEGFIIIVEKTTKKSLTISQTKLIYQHLKKQSYLNSIFEIRSLKYIFITIVTKIQLSKDKQNGIEAIKQAIYTYIEKEEIQEWCLRKQELQVNILQFGGVLQVISLDIKIQNQSIEEYKVAADIKLQVKDLTINS